jgi:uncharacterized Zn finger protein (UPF0148 family)
METHHLGCPNCGAPLDVPLGEVEALCEYCRSKLRFVPEENELEVVRTREEMKHRERIAVEKQLLRNQLEKQEMDRWRETASRVAIAALPIVGRTAGRAAFNAAAGSGGGGCGGCGCLALIAALIAGGAIIGL